MVLSCLLCQNSLKHNVSVEYRAGSTGGGACVALSRLPAVQTLQALLHFNLHVAGKAKFIVTSSHDAVHSLIPPQPPGSRCTTRTASTPTRSCCTATASRCAATRSTRCATSLTATHVRPLSCGVGWRPVWQKSVASTQQFVKPVVCQPSNLSILESTGAAQQGGAAGGGCGGAAGGPAAQAAQVH